MEPKAFLYSCDGKWDRVPAATHEAIATLVRESGMPLPIDYLEFLGLCNGGDGFLSAQPCYLRIWPAEEVIGNNVDYRMREFVPGFFGFGDTGGSEFYAFDTRVSQPWRMVSIPFVPMETSSAYAVAESFSELLSLVCSPENQSCS